MVKVHIKGNVNLKQINKKMRYRVNTVLRGKLGHNFIFVKMKFPDDFAADGVHVADSCRTN